MKAYINILIKFIKKYYPFLIVFTLYITITYLLKIPNCFIKMTIGIPCPGCGLTRAGFSILKLDFIQAIKYNASIFFLPIILWVVIFKERPIINKIYKSKIFWGIIISFIIINYIIRMITVFPNYPLDFEPNSLFGRLYNFICEIFNK